MGRDLLSFTAQFRMAPSASAVLPITVHTAHLESQKQYATSRVEQLQSVFGTMQRGPADHLIIFAGNVCVLYCLSASCSAFSFCMAAYHLNGV